jgi:hypothetical protein
MLDNQIKIVASVSLLPVIADFLEDLVEDREFERSAKMHVNNLIAQIRKLDDRVLNGANMEAMEQQIGIQQAFRQWVLQNVEHKL